MSKAVGLIRRGFHEVPHLMFGTGVFICGAIYSVIGIRRHHKYEKWRRIWKRRYVVVREEDFNPNIQVHDIDHKYPVF